MKDRSLRGLCPNCRSEWLPDPELSATGGNYSGPQQLSPPSLPPIARLGHRESSWICPARRISLLNHAVSQTSLLCSRHIGESKMCRKASSSVTLQCCRDPDQEALFYMEDNSTDLSPPATSDRGKRVANSPAYSPLKAPSAKKISLG